VYSLLAGLWRHRELEARLMRREVVGRYRGSFLGLAWSFFNPLLMLAVYTFVFSKVFQARWAGGSGSTAEFALLLFIGLIVFNLLAECVNRAPTLVLANVNYVKRVVFPLETLPVIILGASLFHTAVSLVVWLLAHLLFIGPPPLTALFLPLLLLPLVLVILGLSWALASLGVYLRDVAQVVAILTTLLMFLSPIFYPLDAVPEPYRGVLYLNPLTPVIEQCRAVLFWGRVPDFSACGLQLALGALVAWGGYAWFQLTRRGFADVL